MAQSMGGYVSQAFMRLFSDGVAASRPLDRSCYAAIELWALKHVKGIYRAIPWKSFPFFHVRLLLCHFSQFQLGCRF